MTVPLPWSASQAASLFDAVIFVHQEDAKVTYLLKVFFAAVLKVNRIRSFDE